MQEIDCFWKEMITHSPLSIVISFSLTFSLKFSVGYKGKLRSIAKSLQTENSGLYLKSFK